MRRKRELTQTEPSLREMLSGGDRRSLAQSRRVHSIVEDSPERIKELVLLANDPDWLVAVRAVDLLEKVAHEHVDWVQPHKRVFIGPVADRNEWEFRLQVVRALPLLKWTPRERERVIDILLRNLKHPQKFVSAWALDSLARFAQDDSKLVPVVKRALRKFEASGSKALRTRARHVRARLEATGRLERPNS